MLPGDDLNSSREGVIRLCNACLIIYLIFELLSIDFPVFPLDNALRRNSRESEFNDTNQMELKELYGRLIIFSIIN
jgi:hypothetical protein